MTVERTTVPIHTEITLTTRDLEKTLTEYFMLRGQYGASLLAAGVAWTLTNPSSLAAAKSFGEQHLRDYAASGHARTLQQQHDALTIAGQRIKDLFCEDDGGLWAWRPVWKAEAEQIIAKLTGRKG